jgi:hypothetical protein
MAQMAGGLNKSKTIKGTRMEKWCYEYQVCRLHVMPPPPLVLYCVAEAM